MLAIISPLPYVHLNETCLVWFPIDIAILFLSPEHKVKYAKGRVAMLALIAVLMLINVLHQPLWAPLLWPLIPMATVAFGRCLAKPSPKGECKVTSNVAKCLLISKVLVADGMMTR